MLISASLSGFHDLLFYIFQALLWFTALTCLECICDHPVFMIYCFISIGGLLWFSALICWECDCDHPVFMIYCFISIGGTVALILRVAICWECNCDHPVFMIYHLILFGHCCFDSPRLFAESVLAGFHDLLFYIDRALLLRFTALICGECNFKYLAFMIYCFILIGGCCFNSPFLFLCSLMLHSSVNV